MKLIDLLVQQLPKRGGWPEGVAAMAQDADGDVQNYKDMDDIRIKGEYALGCSRITGSYSLVDIEPATDRDYAVITREQYEAALQQPVWNAEGLPPVGCECEYSWSGEEYKKGVVKYISKHTVIIETEADLTGDTESAYSPSDLKFRPIRTEAERKREEVAKLINDVFYEYDNKGEYFLRGEGVYDAIAAGKIPGVTLL